MTREHDIDTAPRVSLEALAMLGGGRIAYVKQIRSEDVPQLFPQAPELAPGQLVFGFLEKSSNGYLPLGMSYGLLKVHKAAMKPLAALGHDPSDKMRALALAEDYGKELHTGVFYRSPSPPPTYDSIVRERQRACGAPPPVGRW